MTIAKSPRLAAIEALPSEMQDHALVDWRTVAVLLGSKDVQYVRETLVREGVPLVHVSDRKRLPTWAALRSFIMSREAAVA